MNEMKATDETELNNLSTMQTSEFDEEDDIVKHVRSVTMLPRIPKRKPVIELSVSGDSSEDMTQKSVLERIDRSNERSYDSQQAKWPKSHKIFDEKEGKQKSFSNDRFTKRWDSKSRPWEDDRNDSGRRRYENRSKFEHVNNNRETSDRSGGSGRSERNRDEYIKQAEQKEKTLTADERWAACFPAAEKVCADASVIADNSNEKSNNQNNKIDNSNPLEESSSKRRQRFVPEKTGSKSSRTSSAHCGNWDVDSSKLVKNSREECSTDNGKQPYIKIQEKSERTNLPLSSKTSDLTLLSRVYNNSDVSSTGTSKTLALPNVASVNLCSSRANETPSSTGTGESSPTTYFTSKDTEEYNRRQFDAEWQSQCPDDMSPGFPSFGVDARIPGTKDYFRNSNTASPIEITPLNVNFPMRTFNKMSQSMAMPPDVITALSETSPDTDSPLVTLAPTDTDAQMEVIDMDVSSLSSNDAACADDDNSPTILESNNATKVSNRALDKSVNKAVSFTCPEKTEGLKTGKTKDIRRQAHVAVKKNVQTRVVEELKMLLRPHYEKRKITKDDYKEIMRRAVPRICHGHSTDVPQDRIHSYANVYIEKVLKHRKSKKSRKVGSDPPPPPPPSSYAVPSAVPVPPAALFAQLSDPPPPPPPSLPLFIPPMPSQSFISPIPPPPVTAQQLWNPPPLPVQPPTTALTYLSNIPLPCFIGLPAQSLVTTRSVVSSNGSLSINSAKSRSTL